MIALWCVLSFLGGGLIVLLYHLSHVRLLKSNHELACESLRKEADRLRDDNRNNQQLQLELLRKEFANLSADLLHEKENSLIQTNKNQVEELLKPVREEFAAFRKAVDDNRMAGEVAKNELKNSFESTLKLFALQQQQAVASLKEQTEKIGNDAANLTNVLKNNSKVQGDWGEMILDSILESSGLIKNEHYFIQENIKDEDNNNLRPDVLVHLPEDKTVIIDSKVSLKAYAEAFETDDDEIRKTKLREHVKSVRRHVDELAGKRYERLVKNSTGFVLMFIPNDQSYLYALGEEKDLPRYAYSKGVIIISPSNLMIALQLTYNMWQQEKQNRNVDTIVKTATDLYEKTAGFGDTLKAMESQLSKLNDEFEKAKNQLYSGKGNLFRRIESLKDLGINPKKQIKGLD